MEITKLWIGMLTRFGRHHGTDSTIALSINTIGIERLSHDFADTSQPDQEPGQANIYEIDVAGNGIDTDELTDSSIRLSIRGPDAWQPEHIMIWGKVGGNSVFQAEIIPLAIEMHIETQLSTDQGEGPSSIPLRLVNLGGSRSQINRVFLLTTTGGIHTGRDLLGGPRNPGVTQDTNSPIEIQIVKTSGRLVVLSEIRDTFQSDLRAGGANFYAAPVFSPFSRSELDSGSVTLRLKGLDDWEPTSLFIFGLDEERGRPSQIVPLVHLPVWPHGNMFADTLSGTAEIRLNLLRGAIQLGTFAELSQLYAART